MSFVTTSVQADPYNVSIIQANAMKSKENATNIWITHGLVSSILAPAPPIPYDQNYDNLRVYFIPIKAFVPTISDPNTFGVIFQSNGRHYWMCPSPHPIGKALILLSVPTPVPLPPVGRPSEYYFKINFSDPVGTIYNLHRQKYIQPLPGTDNFSFVDVPTSLSNFELNWHTGTGPVLPSRLDEYKNTFYIMTHNGKALVFSTTSPYLTWADLDFDAQNQKFFFIHQDKPGFGTDNAPYMYNICSFGTEMVLCFDNNNNIDIRPAADAGDWEKLEIVMGPMVLPEYFGRFSITGYKFRAMLRTGPSGSMSLVALPATKDAPEVAASDYFFVIPSDPMPPAVPTEQQQQRQQVADEQ